MKPRTPGVLFGVLLFLLLSAGAGAGQSAGAPPADAAVVARAHESRFRGAESAPITIYEFADFQCPSCRQFSATTLGALDSAYIRTGRARLMVVNFPLAIHPSAWRAAEAALCAGAQGKFWPMHDRLYAEQPTWSTADRPGNHFESYASMLGLDVQAFRACTAEDQVATLLTEDLIQAAFAGVGGTPTFILARQPAAGEDPRNTQRMLVGPRPFEEFERAIGELQRK